MFKSQKGDMIWCQGPYGTKHVGILADSQGEYVYNNSKLHSRVVLESRYAFSGDQPCYLIRRVQAGYKDRAIQRAHSLLGTPYHLLHFNCEQYANYVHYGIPTSPQLQEAIAWTAVAAMSLFAIGQIGYKQ